MSSATMPPSGQVRRRVAASLSLTGAAPTVRVVDVEVRQALAEELSVACGVWRRAETARTGSESSENDYAQLVEAMRASFANPSAKLLVGVADGEVVATIYGVPLRNDQTKAQVGMLAVAPHLWGRQVGTTMLDALVRLLASDGCRHQRMNVDPANERARALYERRGWRHAGETELVGDREELVYRLELGPDSR